MDAKWSLIVFVVGIVIWYYAEKNDFYNCMDEGLDLDTCAATSGYNP